MKKLIIILITLLPNLTWAHQDSYYIYKYDNVTVRFKTGFFFEEINNAKIIGQYAAALSESLEYKSPILLDFIHDYGHSYKGQTFSFLNIGTEEYEIVNYRVLRYDSLMNENIYHLVPTDSIESTKNVEKQVDTIPGFNKNSLVVRQFAFHFDIRETINLLFYAITNQRDVQKHSRSDTLSSYFRHMYYRLESIPRAMVDSVKSSQETPVERLLKTKVYPEADTTNEYRWKYSYYAKNGEYQVFTYYGDHEIVLDTLSSVFSFKPERFLSNELFVFETPNQMRWYSISMYYDTIVERSKKHSLNVDPNMYFKWISLAWLGDDVYFIEYRGFGRTPYKRLIYLREDEMILEGFEDYINSFRRDRNKK